MLILEPHSTFPVSIAARRLNALQLHKVVHPAEVWKSVLRTNASCGVDVEPSGTAPPPRDERGRATLLRRCMLQGAPSSPWSLSKSFGEKDESTVLLGTTYASGAILADLQRNRHRLKDRGWQKEGTEREKARILRHSLRRRRDQ